MTPIKSATKLIVLACIFMGKQPAVDGFLVVEYNEKPDSAQSAMYADEDQHTMCANDDDCDWGEECRNNKCERKQGHDQFDDDDNSETDDDSDNDEDDYFVDDDKDAPIYTFGDPTYYGSGCPEDTVMVVPSLDEQTVSVLFSDYIASTYEEQLRDRRSCNLAVPVEVMQGHSIGIFKVDYRGYAHVPDASGSYAKFRAEYFFAGSRGPKISRTYKDYEDEIHVEDEVQAMAWSECGASTNFRINTSITTRKRHKDHSDVEMGMDTTDIVVEDEQYFKYYIKYKQCDDE